jgi:hypothetical protein
MFEPALRGEKVDAGQQFGLSVSTFRPSGAGGAAVPGVQGWMAAMSIRTVVTGSAVACAVVVSTGAPVSAKDIAHYTVFARVLPGHSWNPRALGCRLLGEHLYRGQLTTAQHPYLPTPAHKGGYRTVAAARGLRGTITALGIVRNTGKVPISVEADCLIRGRPGP